MRGYDEIIAAYDKETMEQIVTHGCQSGVCSQHIYYGDTIKFFDNYEEEIMDYFTDNYDADFLVNLFKDADANLRFYKNNVAWAYIEAVCVDVLSEVDEALLQPI
tara:strand:+ start:186 stop:500 length:315 start_codon:yes stop_codon:yes gene_type:complete